MQLFSAGEAEGKKQTPSRNRHSLRESGIESNRHVLPNPVARGKAPSVRRKHSFKNHSGRGSWGLFLAKVALEPTSEGRSYTGEKRGREQQMQRS